MEQNDIIDKILDFLKSCLYWVNDTYCDFEDATIKANIDADFGTTFMLAVIIAFFFGSGCWAASIASCRNYKPAPHFLLGLIMPWIYPCVILFTLDIKGAKKMRAQIEKEKREAEEAEAERQKNIALNMGNEASAAQDSQQENTNENEALDQEHFRKISHKADGSFAGPWDIVYNGNAAKVLKILEALPELVYVEVQDDKGKVVKMRIPYSIIESWKDA